MPVGFGAALPLSAHSGKMLPAPEHSSLMEIEYCICFPDDESPPGLELRDPAHSLRSFFCVYFLPEPPLGYCQGMEVEMVP